MRDMGASSLGGGGVRGSTQRRMTVDDQTGIGRLEVA